MKPYIIGDFEGIPFEINNRYQVICEDFEAKRILKELVIEGLKLTKEKRKHGYKIPTQFYIYQVFGENKKLPLITRRIYEYKGETIIEHIEDRYTPYDPDIVFLEGTLWGFPFTAYTDYSVICTAPDPDSPKIAKCVERRIEALRYRNDTPDVPNKHLAICYDLMKEPYYKVKRAFIYKTYFDPNMIY